MPYEVKMPQLGMNQDSAVILSWLKAAGDPVARGDAIFEVETDKATMEVEAATDGFLAGIVAAEGDDVPVGDLIALIVESEGEVADHKGVAVGSAQPEPPAMSEPIAEPAQVPDPKPTAPESGKILASPLAKQIAGERGISLEALRSQGVGEPIHAADLSAAKSGGRSQLFAKVDGAALDALLSRSENADRTMLFAAFAAGAWRAAFCADQVDVAILALDGTRTIHANPDRSGSGNGEAPALCLVDLCDTRLGAYAPAGGDITLATAKDGAGYALTLSFSESTLPLAGALALLDAIAARVEDPIRQLL